ncbi:magnesium transporter [Candidatus Poribacteria bacterium]|nr:magnesium transporter [Candidatus Poribacteria bacterium]MYH79199.1 magnesium transporter [Candidatus Poribacteria bacterium]MYK92394.1 magnesium transporter [Candidatus Poribacteria bacterium]
MQGQTIITTHDVDELFISTIVRLIQRRAFPNLRNIIAKTHSADIARWFPRLRAEAKSSLFKILVEEKRMGEVLRDLNSADISEFVEETELSIVADILHTMPADDVTRILSDLPEESKEELLNLIEGATSADVERLLEYEEKTAGSIMTPNFFALSEETTATEATERIRELADVEMVFYVYVVDAENKLKGVLSLRQLVATKPDTPLKDLMTSHLYTVHTDMPQESVARAVARYNLLAIPVINSIGQLVGIVTIDDVVDVIREENTEDMLKMAGTGAVDITSRSIFRNTRARLPWLLASFAGGLIAVYVIGIFESQLKEIAALAAFIPIIMGMGGNIGTQSSTIIVRSIAIGEVSIKDTWQVLWREFSTGALLGTAYGLLLGGFASLVPHFREHAWKLPLVVALAIFVNMIIAATVGTLIPMIFRRIDIDPAVATGPFVTTAIDVAGIFTYFLLAKIFLF